MSLLLIRDNNQCQSSSVRNAIPVWNYWSCLMSICPLGDIRVTVSGADVCCQHGVVSNVELLFAAHVSWIVFFAFYFQGSQSCCLSLTTVCPHSRWASAFATEGQQDAAGGALGTWCGTHYPWIGNKEIWKWKADRCGNGEGVTENQGERPCREKAERWRPPWLVPSALERIQFDKLSHHGS